MLQRGLQLQHVLFVLIRRMRTPLIVLVVTYAISVLGYVLIPGVDEQGRPWRMDFFHALYFVSFMSTTIGFGEIPHPFTFAQRLWTVVSIYATVVAWIYAIGALIAIGQDRALWRIFRLALFTRHVRRLASPFFVVCGYGDTGRLLVRALSQRNLHSVVIDQDPERIELLEIEDLALPSPGLTADASDSATLVHAGLKNPLCRGVAALTHSGQTNLMIAITSRLLRPDLTVISRADNVELERNLRSFETDYVINPFETFAARFAMAIHSPSLYLLYEWVTNAPGALLGEPIEPPRGRWLLCGYGRFGKAVAHHLAAEGLEFTIIEAHPGDTQAPEDTIVGVGTDSATLREAHIESAVGIIAGTDNDANNLSIIVTAKAMKPELFTVARQNEIINHDLFRAAGVDLVMERGDIVARKIMALVMTPRLSEFLALARQQSLEWANVLVSRISGVLGSHSPHTWTIEAVADTSPALVEALAAGSPVRVRHLLMNPIERTEPLPCIALLRVSGGHYELLPDPDTPLQQDDQVLFIGPRQAYSAMLWNVNNLNVMQYLLTGRAPSHITLFHKLVWSRRSDSA